MTAESDARTQQKVLLLYAPPESIRQEVWNLGLVLGVPLALGHLAWALIAGQAASLELLPVTASALACVLFVFWLRHGGEYNAY